MRLLNTVAGRGYIMRIAYGSKKELVVTSTPPISAYERAEISELMGCLVLYNIDNIVDPNSHGLYSDNSLIILDKSTPRKFDNIRKKLHRLFDEFGFKLEIQTDLKIIDYLDIMLNLNNRTVSPFRKNNQNLHFVNMGSSHPNKVCKHIPNGIEYRISTNSSNIWTEQAGLWKSFER